METNETGRYIVLDENGHYLNLILVDVPYPANYYPGYGRYIIYAGPDPVPPIPENKEEYPGFTYLEIRPSMQMSQGARIDILTGEVTPPPPPPPTQEENYTENIENYIESGEI